MTALPKIRIDNRNKTFRLDERFIRRLVLEVLGIIKRRGMGSLEVVFLSDKAIRPLNRKYRGKDRATDVLSFNIASGEFGEDGFFGEIFISTDTAVKNCAIYGTRLEEEIALYVIHGILHLFGYEDYTKDARARMSRKQEKVLERLCTKIDLSKVLMRR
jgi:probable rRNA maturation factor